MKQVIRSRLREYVNRLQDDIGIEITQRQIAKAVGSRQATISDWMSDRPIGYVDSKLLLRLAHWLKLKNPLDLLSIEELENGEGHDNPSPELMPEAAGF